MSNDARFFVTIQLGSINMELWKRNEDYISMKSAFFTGDHCDEYQIGSENGFLLPNKLFTTIHHGYDNVISFNPVALPSEIVCLCLPISDSIC